MPALDGSTEPKFQLEEIMRECNRVYMQQLQPPHDPNDPGNLAPSQQPSYDISFGDKPASWKFLKGLNSLELLYKVLIHFKVDTRRELELNKERMLAEEKTKS